MKTTPSREARAGDAGRQPLMTAARRVAILGAGIMGSSLALFLARRGVSVTLFDKCEEPMACASRWNEGKIHLGYTYGADPSLQTARQLIPGGLAFSRLMAELVGCDIGGAVTPVDDIYLIHRRSVADAAAVWQTYDAVGSLVRSHPDACDYFDGLSEARPRPLSARELSALADQDTIVAGFWTPEKSVNTQWVADCVVDALRAEPRIALRMGVTVSAVHLEDGRWRVQGAPDVDEVYDVVVNALWEGRLAIDRSATVAPQGKWSHRYRLGVFARTDRDLDVPNVVVAVGPFGDLKNYDGHHFYLSWYLAGLVAEGSEITPPTPAALDGAGEARLVAAVRKNLTELMPWTAQIFEAAEELKVRGGYVFAQGQGSLSDPASTLHRRDRFGLRRNGNYFSVDTGKYSTAPWLAEKLAREICQD